ncbi:MAG: hypothetical protein K2X01_03220 [Cyanobacteria bacterium]|nr:hypothetical protein [Cyanobacteriota bacterium]
MNTALFSSNTRSFPRFGERLSVSAADGKGNGIIAQTLSTPRSDTAAVGMTTSASGTGLSISGPHSALASTGLNATKTGGSLSGGPLTAHSSAAHPVTGGLVQILLGFLVAGPSLLLHRSKPTPPSN